MRSVEKQNAHSEERAFVFSDQLEIAPLHGNLTPPVRIYRYCSHLVIFTANDSLLEVIRVVHGRSKWVDLVSE